MKTFNKTLIAVAVTLASSQAMAAGFQTNSQSATGMGRAFAGDAIIADNAAVLARNPAAMALFKDDAYSFGLSYADVQIDVKDVNFTGPVGGEQNLGSIDDAGQGTFIPNIYYINPLNDKVAIGFAAFSNFGTGTDTKGLLPSTPGLAPYDLIGETHVTSANLNASVSYRINDMFSVGVGIDAVYGSGKITRDAPNASLVDVEGTGWGFGGIVGATIELNENHRFGLSYRLSPDIAADGDMSLAGIGALDNVEVPLPDIFQVAGFHQLTPTFAVHYTAQYTAWSSFDEITYEGENGSAGTLKEYGWKDSWLFSVGATYNLNEEFTLRAGYMFDNGVVDEISSISIPDSNRNWYTAGLTYHLSQNSTIDFGIAFVVGEETSLVEKSLIVGDVYATTDSGAVYYSLQYSYQY